MAKAQLSFEFLTYLSIAGLSLLFAIGLMKSAFPEMSQQIGRYEMSILASGINAALLSGQSDKIFVYLPSGSCNSSIEGSDMVTKYGNFSLVSDISLSYNALCQSGTATLQLQYSGSVPDLVRVD